MRLKPGDVVEVLDSRDFTKYLNSAIHYTVEKVDRVYAEVWVCGVSIGFKKERFRKVQKKQRNETGQFR